MRKTIATIISLSVCTAMCIPVVASENQNMASESFMNATGIQTVDTEINNYNPSGSGIDSYEVNLKHDNIVDTMIETEENAIATLKSMFLEYLSENPSLNEVESYLNAMSEQDKQNLYAVLSPEDLSPLEAIAHSDLSITNGTMRGDSLVRYCVACLFDLDPDTIEIQLIEKYGEQGYQPPFPKSSDTYSPKMTTVSTQKIAENTKEELTPEKDHPDNAANDIKENDPVNDAENTESGAIAESVNDTNQAQMSETISEQPNTVTDQKDEEKKDNDDTPTQNYGVNCNTEEMSNGLQQDPPEEVSLGYGNNEAYGSGINSIETDSSDDDVTGNDTTVYAVGYSQSEGQNGVLGIIDGMSYGTSESVSVDATNTTVNHSISTGEGVNLGNPEINPFNIAEGVSYGVSETVGYSDTIEEQEASNISNEFNAEDSQDSIPDAATMNDVQMLSTPDLTWTALSPYPEDYTGWVEVDVLYNDGTQSDSRIYVEDGSYIKGWKQIDENWYYFDENALMVTGWNQIDEKWYYMDSDGARVTGTQEIDGETYQFDSSGVRIEEAE